MQFFKEKENLKFVVKFATQMFLTLRDVLFCFVLAPVLLTRSHFKPASEHPSHDWGHISMGE